MKKLLLMSTSVLSTAVIAGMPVNQPMGSSFTLSSAPNPRALSTSLGNPAAPFLIVNDGFRFGTLGPLSIGTEMGGVDDLDDRVEELENIIDNGSTLADVREANAIIAEIGDSAYIKTSLSVQVPFTPIIYKTKDSGAFILDASISVIGKGSLLTGTAIRIGDTELITDTSYYVQAATDFNIGFGYSQSIWESTNGMLVGGVKANLHQVSQGRSLTELDDDSVDVGDAISDAISDDTVSSSAIGLDLGVMWVSHRYQVGFTVANINEPDFESVSITTNDASDSYGVTTTDTYTMEMQGTLDAAISTLDKKVMLGVSYDTNSVADAVGDKYQWAAASLSYYGDSYFLSGIRVGFRQNLAGSELSYATAGLTFLTHLSLDLAVSLDTIEGSDEPRSSYFAIGYDTSF